MAKNEHQSEPEPSTQNDGGGAPTSPLSPLASPLTPLIRVVRLARKELREILRDRRTIVTLFAMPLLLYPLMSVAFEQFYLARAPRSEERRVGKECRL